MTANRRNQAQAKLYVAKPACAAMLVFLLVGGGRLLAESGMDVQKDAAAAMKILQAWESEGRLSKERVLHIIAWRCRDRDFPSDYRHPPSANYAAYSKLLSEGDGWAWSWSSLV